MSGVIWDSFKQGDRSELLADYLLSGIGTTTPVRRQDDIGFDLHCQIANEEKELLTFGHPFLIQIKSKSKSTITYGHKTLDKWKSENIQWLFKQEVPFLVGIVDKTKFSINIYNTTGLWFLLYENSDCTRITLKPRIDNYSTKTCGRPIRKKIKEWKKGYGDGYEYVIDLGNPIINLTNEDFDNEETLSKKKEILKVVIQLEQMNILHRNNGIPHFKWITNNLINAYSIGTGWMHYAQEDKRLIDSIYHSIAPSLLSLTINLHKHKRFEELEELKPVLWKLKSQDIPTELAKRLPEVFDWIKDLKDFQ